MLFISPSIYFPSFIERKVLKNTKKVVSISKFTQGNIKRFCKHVSKVIYHGVDIDEFKPLKNDKFRRKMHLSNELKIILFVGHYFERKGLIELMHSLKDIEGKYKLLVVGKERSDKYEKLASELKIENKIIFIGHSNNVKNFFQISDIFILPTKVEPFGLVTLEACSCKLPVITTNKSRNGCAELLTNGVNSILLKNEEISSKEIFNSISLLLNNSKLRKKLGNNARKVAVKNTWNKVYNNYLKLYNEKFKMGN